MITLMIIHLQYINHVAELSRKVEIKMEMRYLRLRMWMKIRASYLIMQLVFICHRLIHNNHKCLAIVK